MIAKSILFLTNLLLFFSMAACGGKTKAGKTGNNAPATVQVPQFDADSAYSYIARQVGFGPRVPNTEGHVACGNYLAAQLQAFGATVTNQYADLVAYNGTLLKARNIIGSYNPENKKRIALFAHWDTRPWADNDSNKAHQHTPIDGANDGASGVGVLLEIARHIQQQQPALGIDIVFFDAEDYGAPQFYEGTHTEESWCLGAQHWARNPHTDNYRARFGLLLDMVGGKGSLFFKEGYSEEFASDINDKVWKAAQRIGYGHLFVDNNQGMGFITDDHLFVNRLARIKTIDIIAGDAQGNFVPTWHTTRDNLEQIDKQTLKAVGQTVLEVIYKEQ